MPLSNISRNSLYLFFPFLLLPSYLVAAPCCGGSSLLPSLITGDDRAQFAVTLANDTVVSDAFSTGDPVPRDDGDLENTLTAKLSAAYLFSDRWQGGLDIPVAYRRREVSEQSEKATGLGDIGTQVGFEFLPEREYSSWKPKGFVFTRFVVPAGQSIYDSANPGGADNIGKGFYSLALGVVLTRTWGNFDVWLSGEGHWLLPRTFEETGSAPRKFSSGWGTSGLIGAGYSPGLGNFRVGLFLSPVFEGERTMTVATDLTVDSRVAWSSGMQASYRFNDDWSSTLTYSDQTLIGHAVNNSLSRSISLLILRRFPL